MGLSKVFSPPLPSYLIIAYTVSTSVVIQQTASISGGEASDSSWLSVPKDLEQEIL